MTHPSHSALPPRLLPLSLLGLALLIPVVAGFEGRRTAQILLQALPAALCLLWPLAGRRARTAQALLTGAYGLLFVSDGISRAFLAELYQAAPNSTLVLSAVANSTPNETFEYASMQWRALLAAALAWLGCAALLSTALLIWWRKPPPPLRIHGWRWLLVGLSALLIVAAIANKPSRRHHPLVFWTDWWNDVAALKVQWSALQDKREELLARARAMAPTLAPTAPDTFVLVISDSINRDNMGLYGYARATTPRLSAFNDSAQDKAAPPLSIFRHAWSVDAATIPALRRLFYFAQETQPQPPHLLALARAAGYRIWWIGNHNDLAVEQEHAQLSDQVRMLNQTPGRSTNQPDSEVLGTLRAALADPSERKLIVLHLLGAHPHYRLRYPAGAPGFKDDDAVAQSLKSAGRPLWLRLLRNDYDTAIRHHDSVVAATLDLAREGSGRRVWLYLSDHGQEVGHERNQAGHSPSTSAGYRIPLLVWRSESPPIEADRLQQPVRADWLGHSISGLLGLSWPEYASERDVLSPDYRWHPPALPFATDFRD